MVIHVCLAVTFWHCERSAAAAAAGKKWPGSNFCKVGYRQQWPGEFSSLNVKGIEQVHFWTVRALLGTLGGWGPCSALPQSDPFIGGCTHRLRKSRSSTTT